MQKMVLTKINSIELTNDGNSILREIDVGHPSARCLIELSATQDENCGDGTTTVLILAATLLERIVPLLKKSHPLKICRILKQAQKLCIENLRGISQQIKEEEILKYVSTGVSTKLCKILNVPIPELALRAIELIAVRKEAGSGSDAGSAGTNKNNDPEGEISIDIKNDVKIEKMLGELSMSEVIDGILIEKDIIHSQMRKRIENPRILILETSLEYKKGESVTNFEFSDREGFTRALEIEEEQVKKMCDRISECGADIVVTEKGISDLALGILQDRNITALRRLKKSDAIRLAKGTGATIITRIEDVQSDHLGRAGLFEYSKINKDYYCKFTGCLKPGPVTLALFAPSNEILVELERNFMDGIKVAKNLIMSPWIVPGGGATEMSMARCLQSATGNKSEVGNTYANATGGGISDSFEKEVYIECAEALRIIPSIIANNSGIRDVLATLLRLESSHDSSPYYGINGVTGEIEDMSGVVMECYKVKEQIIKSSFEAVIQLLRVDGIIESKLQ